MDAIVRYIKHMICYTFNSSCLTFFFISFMSSQRTSACFDIACFQGRFFKSAITEEKFCLLLSKYTVRHLKSEKIHLRIVQTIQRPNWPLICQLNGNFVSFQNMCYFKRSDLKQSPKLSLSKTGRISHTRTWNLTLNFEAVWGQNGLQKLLLVEFRPNIVLQWYSLP